LTDDLINLAILLRIKPYLDGQIQVEKFTSKKCQLFTMSTLLVFCRFFRFPTLP